MIVEIPKMADCKEINNLAKQVHELHVNWRPDIFLSVDEVIKKEELKEKINNKKIFVAKEQNHIVGYIIFDIKEKNNPNMKYRKQLHIEAICVDEKNRNRGIGTELLKFVRVIAKENNCTDIHLTVNEENIDAIKLYEKFGFKVMNIAYSMHI